jgi:hypothetical protein
MSMIATPSIWNAVETPMRGLKALDRPLEDGLGLLSLERDRQLACFQFVDEFEGAHAATSTSRLLRAGSSRASAPSSSSERRRW